MHHESVHQAAVLRGEPEAAGQDPRDAAIKRMRETLTRIARWVGQFPATGRFWDDAETDPMSYGAAFGSNGERDYMRSQAIEALHFVDALLPEPPQAASGSSHTARSDVQDGAGVGQPEAPTAAPLADVTAREVAHNVFALCEEFENVPSFDVDSPEVASFKAGQRFAAKRIRNGIGIWLTDEENERKQAHPPARSGAEGEQGATPPAPAALDLRTAKHCCAILGAACEHHTHREIREAWQALRSALAASPQPAAPAAEGGAS